MQIDCLHCSIWFSKETAIFALHRIFWLVFLLETECLLWDWSWFHMAVPIATMCPTANYGTLNRLTSPTRLKMLSADAIKLLWVQTEENPTYLLPCSQRRRNKCCSKQNAICSHRVSLSQTQWCRQCTRVAKGTNRFWLEFHAIFGP